MAPVEVQGACDGFEMPKGSWTMRRLAAAQRDASRLLQPCLALSLEMRMGGAGDGDREQVTCHARGCNQRESSH